MNAEMNPQNISAHISLGRDYWYRFMIEKALLKYKNLYQMYPDDHSFLWDISNIYLTNSDFKSALHYTKKYVSIYPDEAKSYLYLGYIYLHFGYNEEATANIEKALLIDPNNIDYLSYLAWSKLYVGKFDETLKICEHMHDLSTLPEHYFDSYNCFEEYYTLKGEIRKSIAIIEKRIEKTKEWEIGNFNKTFSMAEIALHYVSIGKFDKALEMLKESDENRIELLEDEGIFNYIEVYYELKDTKKLQDVIIYMEDLIKSDPYFYNKERIFYTKGLLNELEGNYVGAIDNHKKSLEFDQTAQPQLLSIARCYRLNGDFTKAREYINSILYPYDGYVKYESALIFAANGQIDNAKNELLLSLEIWSNADADHFKVNEARLKLVELTNSF